MRKQTDSDNDDVSWWSSYLSWFYPSFAVLMTYDYDFWLCLQPIPFQRAPAQVQRTSEIARCLTQEDQAGEVNVVFRGGASSQTVTNPYNFCE